MKSFILNFRAFLNERKVLKRNEEIFLPVKDGVLTQRYRFVYTEKIIVLSPFYFLYGRFQCLYVKRAIA